MTIRANDYVGEALPQVEPEGFLHSGWWIRLDNRRIEISYNLYRGIYTDTQGNPYLPTLNGRLYPEHKSPRDLIRPATEEELRVYDAEGVVVKEWYDYIKEGMVKVEPYEVYDIPPAWQEFIQNWADFVIANRMGCDVFESSLLRRHFKEYPNEVSFRMEQRYLQSVWHVQNPTKHSPFKEGYITQYRVNNGRVDLVHVARSMVAGGDYYSELRPNYHTTPSQLRQHNKPYTDGVGRTYNPITNWQAEMEREVARKQNAGEYAYMPEEFPAKWGTGVHISTQNANLLAYYPTFRHWQRRVPQQIKAGRYLKAYFPHLSDDEIRRFSAEIGTGELKFYSDWYDMFKVYRDLDENGIVSSCMSKDSWGSVHPLMVYDNSDVELAVLYMSDKPVARALYNKTNKHFPMIYGQWEKMEVALRAAGFIHSSMCGARIRRLPRYVSRECPIEHGFYKVDAMPDYDQDSDVMLMPYIDHQRELDRSHNCSTSVDVYHDHIVIRYDGEYEANNHDGASIDLSRGRCTCDHCGDRVDEDDTYYMGEEEISICRYCYDHHTVQVYTSYSSYSFTCMQDTADSRYIWVDAADRYYRDNEAVREAGYCWSDQDDCWYHEDDCVFVEELSDYISTDEVRKSVMWDEEDCEYVTTETYNERVAEREQQSQEAA